MNKSQFELVRKSALEQQKTAGGEGRFRVLSRTESEAEQKSLRSLDAGGNGWVFFLYDFYPFMKNSFGGMIGIVSGSKNYDRGIVFVDSSLHVFQFFNVGLEEFISNAIENRFPSDILSHAFKPESSVNFDERSAI